MAWEDFDRHGRRGMTGDRPIDEMSLALGRITKAYKEQYDRCPTIDEILHTLTVVLRTDPEAYLQDPTVMKNHVAILGPLPRK